MEERKGEALRLQGSSSSMECIFWRTHLSCFLMRRSRPQRHGLLNRQAGVGVCSSLLNGRMHLNGSASRVACCRGRPPYCASLPTWLVRNHGVNAGPQIVRDMLLRFHNVTLGGYQPSLQGSWRGCPASCARVAADSIEPAVAADSGGLLPAVLQHPSGMVTRVYPLGSWCTPDTRTTAATRSSCCSVLWAAST